MTFIRSLLFTGIFMLGTAAISILCIPFLLLSEKQERKVVLFWSGFIMKCMKVFAGLSYEIKGIENLPKGGAIIASKHQSAFETFAFPSFLENVVFILKKELLTIPFFGWHLKKIGCVGIDRSAGAKAAKKMLNGCSEELNKGKQVVIFPEGTRTAHNSETRYQPGIYLLYKNCGVPVIPVALNSGLFWGRATFTKKAGKITIKFLPAIEPDLSKKDFMAKLEETIETAYKEIADKAIEEYPAISG